MTGRIRTASLLALLCAVATCGRIAAQAPVSPTSSPLRPGYEPVQMQRGAEPASQAAPIHIAVVGAVRNPAVYRTQRPRTFVELIDLAATLEDFAGLEPGLHFGRSVRALLTDPRGVHRDAAFSEGGFLLAEEPLLEAGDTGQYRHKQAIQHERTELAGRVAAVRTAEWCYVERLYEGPELYDRAADPMETTNLAGRPEHAATERQLRDRMFRWLFETSDVVPARRDPRFDDDLQRAIFTS